MLAAIYMVVRTLLLVWHDMGSEFERTLYYITDSTLITIFGLVPYTIIFEKYPKWWHYIIAISPLVLIPITYVTHLHFIAMWSHLLPILIGLSALFYLGKNAHRIDHQLPNYFANPELHAKSWIIYISIAYLVLTCLSLLRYIIPGHIGYNMAIIMVWCVIMFVLFLFLIRQQPVDQPEEEEVSGETDNTKNIEPDRPNAIFSSKNTGGVKTEL